MGHMPVRVSAPTRVTPGSEGDELGLCPSTITRRLATDTHRGRRAVDGVMRYTTVDDPMLFFLYCPNRFGP